METQKKACEYCGEKFEARRSSLYCCDKCRDAAGAERRRKYKQEHKEPVADGKYYFERICEHCKEKFVGGRSVKMCPMCREMRKKEVPDTKPAPKVKKYLSLGKMASLVRLSGKRYGELQRMETYEPEAFEALRERYGV